MYLPAITCTVPFTSYQITSAGTGIADTAFRPSVRVYIPIRIKRLNTTQMGTCIINLDGTVSISDVICDTVANNFWPAGWTNCGTPSDTTITFMQ